MQHLQPNTTLQGGKYRIERVLGQGGFGITYLARNTVFDIDVAIKEFFMKDENDRDGSSVTMPNTTKQELFHGQMEKFKKEAKRMFAIKNEHVIGVQDLFEENGTAYYVMDYVDGESLAERLKRTNKPMTEQEVRAILPQILDALKAVHHAGIWHLDLKPANIMVDKSGNVKLIDFGASKQLNAQKGGATTSTAISYTNGYAPREQMEQNYDKFGPWTDIYALGATLYNLLTNKRPPLPTDIDDDISEDKHLALAMPTSIKVYLKKLILWLMQTNKADRPQNIDDINQYLSNSATNEMSIRESIELENQENTLIQNEETLFENTKSTRQRKTKWMFIIVVLCLTIVVVGYLFGHFYFSKSYSKAAVIANNLMPYDVCHPYSEGMACVEVKGKCGFIDKNGYEIIQCKYDDAEGFSEGLAGVEKGGKWGFIDRNGNEIIPCMYDYTEGFSEGLAGVKKGGKWGFIDRNGNEIIPCMYDYTEGFSEGLAGVKKGGKWGFIDRNGNEIIPCKYYYTEGFSEGMAYVEIELEEGRQFAYIDKTGIQRYTSTDTIYGPREIKKYDFKSYSHGMVGVWNNGKYGYIDKMGNVVIPFGKFDKYDDVYYESKVDLFIVMKDWKYGIIDRNYNELVPLIYDDIYPFFEGCAFVVKNEKLGCIDKNGKEIIPCIYNEAAIFSEGVAFVKKDGHWGCVDNNGNVFF